jgi:alpha-1,2-mannosyltransferase
MATRPGAEAQPTRGGAPPAAATDAGARAWLVYVVIVACTAVALLLRAYQLCRPGYLFGITEYDDGVLFGNSVRLVDGVIPYRDFAMVQPPGSTLLMAPVALIAKVTGTAWGLAIARIATVCADSACVALIGLLVRHRGPLSVAIACGIYAVYPDALVASGTYMLEPWLNLFCLAGALLAFDRDRFAPDRRLAAAGAAFGFAVAIKLWAAFPLLVIGLLLVRTPRRLAVLAGGAVAGFGVPVLPFLILAPGKLVTGVLISQFVRSNSTHGILPRLADLAGLSVFPRFAEGATIGILLVLAGYLFVAYPVVVMLGRRRLVPLDCYALLGLVAVVAMFALPADYYSHYGSFAGPFIALAAALPVCLLRPAGTSGHPATAQHMWVLGALPLVVITGIGLRQLGAETHLAAPHPARTADRLVPAGSCVLTNDPALTIVANRFVSTDGSCPDLVDSFGTFMVMTDGRTDDASSRALRAVELAWQNDWFPRAAYFWLGPKGDEQIPWSPGLYAYFTSHFRLIWRSSGTTPAWDVPYEGLYIRR